MLMKPVSEWANNKNKNIKIIKNYRKKALYKIFWDKSRDSTNQQKQKKMQAQSQSSTAKSSSSVFSSLTNNKFVNYIRWLYMQYLLNTALYMLEPFEVRLFNFVMILILVTWAYSTYVFLPSQIMRFIQSFSNDSVQVYIWS